MAVQFAGIIPARYASSRFPGKPLVDLNGKPMIQVVYEHVAAAGLDVTAVATDDRRIADAVALFGGTTVMTSSNHLSGTDRCEEAARTLRLHDEDIILNIQGDEPLIGAREILLLKAAFNRPEVEIATLVRPETDLHVVNNPNHVKVTLSNTHKALYFSRHAIPFMRDTQLQNTIYHIHIGMYAYRYKTLKELARLKPTSLEMTEKLEQLRWLQNDCTIYAIPCNYKGFGIDTPEDLDRLLRQHPIF